MTPLLVLLTVLSLAEVVGLGYVIYIDYRARHTFTPGEAAIFREMRRVLDEANR
jgi:hypothetical protein